MMADAVLLYVILLAAGAAWERIRYRAIRQRWERSHPRLKWEDWQHVIRR